MASNEDPTEAEIVAQEAERASSRQRISQGSIGEMIEDPDTDTERGLLGRIGENLHGKNSTRLKGRLRQLNRASRDSHDRVRGFFPEHWTDSKDAYHRLRELKEMGLAQAQQLWPNYEKVVELSLSGSATVSSDLLFVSELFPKLSIVKLYDCWNINDFGLAHLAHLKQLSNVYLGSFGSKITDAGLKSLAQCKMLSELDLIECKKITDKGLLYLARGCPQLSNLNLRGCSKITDKGLVYLEECKKTLSNLNLSGCWKITDDGIESLALCPRLTNLDLAGCNITDDGIAHLALCPQLTNLDLSGCDITDAGLAHLARGCRQLSYLYFFRCRQITDKGLKSLVYGCPQLKNMCFEQSVLITDAGLAHLAHLKQLSYLNLSGCDITFAGLMQLEACTQLKTLHLKGCHKLVADGNTEHGQILVELFTRIPSLERIWGIHGIPHDRPWNASNAAQSVSSSSSSSGKFVETLKLRF